MPLHVHFDTQLRSKTENTWPFLESHDYNPQIKVINSHLILIDENLIPDLFFCFFSLHVSLYLDQKWVHSGDNYILYKTTYFFPLRKL